MPHVALEQASYCDAQLAAMHESHAAPVISHCTWQLVFMQFVTATRGAEAFGQDCAKHCWVHALKSAGPAIPVAPASARAHPPRHLSVSAHETVPVP